MIKMLTWPDTARVSNITFPPPQGIDVERWKDMLVNKNGPAADRGGRVDNTGLHTRGCGRSSCSAGIGVLMLSADVSATGGSIQLRQPEGTSRKVKALIEGEADQRTPGRAPKFWLSCLFCRT